MKNIIAVIMLSASTCLFASDADGSGTEPGNNINIEDIICTPVIQINQLTGLEEVILVCSEAAE